MYQSPTSFKLLPDVIKNLMIINGIFFLATVVLQNVGYIDLVEKLGLFFPISEHFLPFQVVTHMFMHGSISHIFFNMFALWMFGYSLENVWGSKRFLIYYMATGLGAAALHLGVNYIQYLQIKDLVTSEQMEILLREGRGIILNGQYYTIEAMNQANLVINTPTVGASGAVFGILMAFGLMFPNQYIYLYFAIPIKVKYFVIGYGALELYSGFLRANDGVAHFAHLGGMLFGFLLIRYWRSNGSTRHF